MKRILVTGAGGFIGHHLVKRLKSDGHWVRGADIKWPEYERTTADEFCALDLRNIDNCLVVTQDIDEVYHLAADMGGIGYITAYLADIARNNVIINANMLEAAKQNSVKKFLFSSSACVYAQSKQHDENVVPLKEADAHPADPEPGYGWEKLFTEQMCKYYAHDFGLDTRIVRFHNVYGPLGTYDGGKEKAPAAVSRKIALAEDGEEVEVWGDGKQTRSFMYIDDCVDGLVRLMDSKHQEPLNLGTEELISINDLFDKVARIAGKTIVKKHDLSKPQGVRGRNSDNSKLREILKWEPSIKLDEGLKATYEWIEKELVQSESQRRFETDEAESVYKIRWDFPISANSLVYDLGGYTGEWAQELVRVYDPYIHIFEPVKEFYDVLVEKFRNNPKVIVFNFGVLDKNCRVKIDKDASASSLFISGHATEEVEMRDIASLPVPELLNINAEGAEFPVLRRMLETGWAENCRHIQVQFHSFYPNALKEYREICKALKSTHTVGYSYPFVWEAWSKHGFSSALTADKFYAQFMRPGDLVFDIGAHVGGRSSLFRRHGCRVVAAEPEKECLAILKKKFYGNPGVIVLPVAVGSKSGVGDLAVGDALGISTLSVGWRNSVIATHRFGNHEWKQIEKVPVTTLDTMIAEFGVPSFIKIDVEGYENEVLKGLSRPVKALSFEFHPEYLSAIEQCVAHLSSLGVVRFNYSLGESMKLELSDWITGENLLARLNEFRESNTIYGDVYARFV